MNGGDHGQPPLDGGISGGLDLDALVGLKASGRIQEGADEIRSQEAGGFVVSQRKVSVSPGRAILGGVRTSTREHHPAEHTGISQPGDLTRRELGVMGLDNAAAPVDRQVHPRTDHRGDLVVQTEELLLARSDATSRVTVLDDDGKSSVLEETGELNQRRSKCFRVGLTTRGGMDLDPPCLLYTSPSPRD